MNRCILAAVSFAASAALLLAAFVANAASSAVTAAKPATVTVMSYVIPVASPPVIRTDPTRAVRMYIVRQGDYLSKIAVHMCSGHINDWTGIFQANRHVIGTNPNLILAGQVLAIECKGPVSLLASASKSYSPAHADGKVWGVTYGYPNYYGDGDGDGYDVAGPSQPQRHFETARYAPAPAHSSVNSSFQACVISRESGGNSQVMNSTGHYGLYQFSFSTWTAHGGNPSDFGHASASEQTQVFFATVAQDGTSDWAPYDGC